MLLSSLTFVLLSFLSTQTVEAYTWAFDNPPSQCGPLSVSITDGTDGDPPFDLAIIPYGPTPLFSVEVRTVQTITFNTSTNLNFTLNYPAASQLVAVMSDQNGFATGGTSTVWTVEAPAAGSAECFDPNQEAAQAWEFTLDPADGFIRSCESYQVGWNGRDSNVTGTPFFSGVIPSGQSFSINSTFSGSGFSSTGFTWTVPVSAETDLILLSGDERAIGTGGYVDYKVQPPSSTSTTACVTSMPSATSGIPAGGYPNGGSTSSTSPNNTVHKQNVGAIAGGVVGGIAGLVLVSAPLAFLLRRRRKRQPVDLGDEQPAFVTGELSTITSPTPFDPQSLYSTSHGTDSEHPYSLTESSLPSPPFQNFRPMSDLSSASHTRKVPVPPSNASQVTFVRHVDSGRVDMSEAETEPETIELPPLYDHRFIDRGETESSSS